MLSVLSDISSSRHVAVRRLAGGEAVGAGPVGLGRKRPTP